MHFDIDPMSGENLRACGAIAKEVLPAGRASAILVVLYATTVAAAFVFAPRTAVITSVIGIAGIMATALALQAEGRSRLRKLQEQDPHGEEVHHVELSPEGVRTWCTHVEARYPWSDFAKVTEDQEFYLFVRPNGSGAAIPKRLLDKPGDEALRSRIREWAADRGAALAREL